MLKSTTAAKRYMFSFPERAQQDLDRLYDDGVFTSKGEVVREALHIARTLQKEAAHGYTEVLVRHSQGHERVLVIPRLIEESEVDPKRKAKRLKTNERAH